MGDDGGRPRRSVAPVRYNFEPSLEVKREHEWPSRTDRALRSRRPHGGYSEEREDPQSAPRSSRRAHDRRRSPTPGHALERGDDEEADEVPGSDKKLRWRNRGRRTVRRVIDDDDEEDDDAGGQDAGRGAADGEADGGDGEGDEDPHAALRGREPSRRIASGGPRASRGGGEGDDDDDDDGGSDEEIDEVEDGSEEDDDPPPRARRPDRRRQPARPGGREISRRRAASAGGSGGARAKRGRRHDDSEDFHGEDEEEEEEEEELETDSDDDDIGRAPGRRRASKRQRQQVQRFSPKREDEREREQLAPAGLRSGRDAGNGGSGGAAAAGRQRRYYAEDLVAGIITGGANGGTGGGGGLSGPWLSDGAAGPAHGAAWPALAPGPGGSLVPSGSGVPPTPGAAAAAAGRGLEHTGGGRSGADIITPLVVDPSLTFDQVGGLQRYVAALKEMVFLPLLYPEVFERFALAPPRGVLLYGPPGTGKTLLARALAASCGRAGARVSFFMRKGADILSKWVGESERQLRLLFEEAQRQQPSIIFFDEIDGLAPVRSSKSDQIHNSLVSTLLALMDGLDSRGRIVVIGATNRVDAIDGALRRPGRFDRELAFPLPNASARREILAIHTRGWACRPEEPLLERLADACVGYCGADLKALATEAAVRALRRRYPQIYASEAKLAIDPSSIRVSGADWDAARASVVPAAHRGAAAHARPLPAGQRSLLGGALSEASAALGRLFPPAAAAGVAGAADAAPGAGSDAAARRCVPLGMRLAATDSGDDDDDDDGEPEGEDAEAAAVAAILAAASPLARRPRLLLAGAPGAGQGALAAALLHSLEMFPVHALGLPSLLADGGARSAEEALVAAVAEARRAAPAVLYLPHLGGWWDAAGPMLRATLVMLLEDLPPELPLLLLATADGPLEAEVLCLFSGDQVLNVGPPDAAARAAFWRGALAVAAAGASRAAVRAAARRRRMRRALAPPQLALAPRSAAEVAAAAAASTAAAAAAAGDLRALRVFLRDALAGLLPDRRFKDFWAQPSEEAFPGWRDAAGPRAVDLTRMLGRVNEGAYAAPSAFMADVAALPATLLRYFGGQPPDQHDRMLVIRAHDLADHLADVVERLDAGLAARLEDAARKAPPPATASGAGAAAAAAAAAATAAAEASAAAARATRRNGAEPLPELKIGRSAPDPEEIARQARAARRLEEAQRKAEADAAAAAEAAEAAAREAAEAVEREAAEARERAVREAAEAAERAAREAAEAAEREAAAAAAAPEEEGGDVTDEDIAAALPARVAALVARLTAATAGALAGELQDAAARLGDAVRALQPNPGRAAALDAAVAFAARLEAEAADEREA